jgi:hypothetical protein
LWVIRCPYPSRRPRRGPNPSPPIPFNRDFQAGRQAPGCRSLSRARSSAENRHACDPSQATVATTPTITGTPYKRYKPSKVHPTTATCRNGFYSTTSRRPPPLRRCCAASDSRDISAAGARAWQKTVWANKSPVRGDTGLPGWLPERTLGGLSPPTTTLSVLNVSANDKSDSGPCPEP